MAAMQSNMNIKRNSDILQQLYYHIIVECLVGLTFVAQELLLWKQFSYYRNLTLLT